MLNDKEYHNDAQKLYEEKKDADIYAILDFCEKYDGKLELQHIYDLLRLLYGDLTISEQNECIVNLLDSIVKTYGQEAVNIIVEETDVLIDEKSENCLFLVLAMILFWNKKQQLDIVTPLKNAQEPIKKLYKRFVSENMKYVSGSNKELLESVEKRLSEI